jgi:hypothetical protein
MDERIAITNHKNSNRMSIWLNYSEDEKMVLLQQTLLAETEILQTVIHNLIIHFI